MQDPRGWRVIDPLSMPRRGKISPDVKQNLVRLPALIMHPWDLDRFRVRIEEARRERANGHKPRVFSPGLMDQRAAADAAVPVSARNPRR